MYHPFRCMIATISVALQALRLPRRAQPPILPAVAFRLIPIDGHGIAEVLSDPIRLAMLETGRRLSRPITPKEVAEALGLDPTAAQRGLDSLADAGLLQRLPMRAHRRAPSYRADVETLTVTFDPRNADQCAALFGIERILGSSVAGWSDETRGCDAFDGKPWPLRSYRTLQFTPEELAEFRRLLHEVMQFIESSQASRKRLEAKAASEVNVTLMLHAGKAALGALPLPTLHFVPSDHAQTFAQSSPANGVRDLSARERQVGMMLANGLSRPEIARELGISLNTVATLSKRIHVKLGVKRRAELSNRIRRGV